MPTRTYIALVPTSSVPGASADWLDVTPLTNGGNYSSTTSYGAGVYVGDYRLLLAFRSTNEKITALISNPLYSGGKWLYDWVAQQINSTTGSYETRVPALSGNTSSGPFMTELNNNLVDTPTYVFAFFRGLWSGQSLFDFDRCCTDTVFLSSGDTLSICCFTLGTEPTDPCGFPCYDQDMFYLQWLGIYDDQLSIGPSCLAGEYESVRFFPLRDLPTVTTVDFTVGDSLFGFGLGLGIRGKCDSLAGAINPYVDQVTANISLNLSAFGNALNLTILDSTATQLVQTVVSGLPLLPGDQARMMVTDDGSNVTLDLYTLPGLALIGTATVATADQTSEVGVQRLILSSCKVAIDELTVENNSVVTWHDTFTGIDGTYIFDHSPEVGCDPIGSIGLTSTGLLFLAGIDIDGTGTLTNTYNGSGELDTCCFTTTSTGTMTATYSGSGELDTCCMYVVSPSTYTFESCELGCEWESPITGTVTVELWGPGGNGGDALSLSGGGGGGGGYVKVLVDVTVGQVYDVVVGGGGSGIDTEFDAGGVSAIARYGNPGSVVFGGNGGSSDEGGATLVVKSDGGDGAASAASNYAGAGGGGAGGTSGDGADGATSTEFVGGAGGAAGGGTSGAGGAGGDNPDGDGTDGASPGGGGGGGGNSTGSGGAGGDGKVVITL